MHGVYLLFFLIFFRPLLACRGEVQPPIFLYTNVFKKKRISKKTVVSAFAGICIAFIAFKKVSLFCENPLKKKLNEALKEDSIENKDYPLTRYFLTEHAERIGQPAFEWVLKTKDNKGRTLTEIAVKEEKYKLFELLISLDTNLHWSLHYPYKGKNLPLYEIARRQYQAYKMGSLYKKKRKKHMYQKIVKSMQKYNEQVA